MKDNKNKAKRKTLIIVCIVLAVIAVSAIFAVISVFMHLGKINRINPEDQYTLSQEEADKLESQQVNEETTSTAPSINENEIQWAQDSTKAVGNEKEIINILLIGQDRRSGEGRARSDSIILCTFNIKAKTITTTSFLRDLYVQIPGYEDTRINTAYALGGMELLDECLKVNFGIHVDANIEVDFSGFEEVVNLLGGVDIYLSSEESWYMNKENNWSLSEGMNHLNGEQALAYSRIRYIDSDFNRTRRQRTVINNLFETYKNADVSQLSLLLDTILPLMTTDMSTADIAFYTTQILPILSKSTMEAQMIPIDGSFEFATIRGMSVLVPDLEKNRQFLIDTLTPQAME